MPVLCLSPREPSGLGCPIIVVSLKVSFTYEKMAAVYMRVAYDINGKSLLVLSLELHSTVFRLAFTTAYWQVQAQKGAETFMITAC